MIYLALYLALCGFLFLNICALISPPKWALRSSTAMRALEPSDIEKLNDIREKHKRLSNVATAEAEQEASTLSDLAAKYGTYIEVKKLMVKFRSLYKNESSSPRKAKQLRSFVSLYENQLELEKILREQLGITRLPVKGPKDDALVELERINKHIAQLESTLVDVELKIPQGMLTRQQRST